MSGQIYVTDAYRIPS